MDAISVLLTDYAWPDVEVESSVVRAAGFELVVAQAGNAASVAELARRHEPAAIMTCWAPVTAEAIHASQSLKLVARMGIGLDNIDVAACTRAGIVVSNVPDYCVEEVSDHAIALLLAWARSVTQLNRRVHEGHWEPAACRLRRVRDLTVGIVGYGRIGRRTCQKLEAFGCNLLISSRNPHSTGRESPLEHLSLGALLARSDVVILHVPLTSANHHLIGAAQIAQMKPGSLLINVSRGGLVDTDAVIDAVGSGHIYAALDVLEAEPTIPPGLCALDNALLTPHVAFSSTTSVLELRRRASEEVVRVLRGEAPFHPCNEISVRPDVSSMT